MTQHADDWLYIMAIAEKALHKVLDDVQMDQGFPACEKRRASLVEALTRRLKLVGDFVAPAPWVPPKRRGWVGVDLDRTLAYYERWIDVAHVGAPIGPMMERVRQVLAADQYDVRIMTARVSPTSHPPDSVRDARHYIELWCREHFGRTLEVTCEKDADMVELWDDRAVGVEENTGTLLSPSRVLGKPEDLHLSPPSPAGQLNLPGTAPAEPPRKRAPRSTSKKTVARR
jgi:hypothetical protein